MEDYFYQKQTRLVSAVLKSLINTIFLYKKISVNVRQHLSQLFFISSLIVKKGITEEHNVNCKGGISINITLILTCCDWLYSNRIGMHKIIENNTKSSMKCKIKHAICRHFHLLARNTRIHDIRCFRD